MAKVFIEESTLTDIADAVRAKNGTTEPIKTVELATAITNLPTGGKGALELLYTEGAEITAEDWGDINLSTTSGNGATIGLLIRETKCKSIKFSDSQLYGIGLSTNPNLEEYDSGVNAVIDSNSSFNFFRICSNLKKLTMGENFLPFGNYAFTGATSLKEVRYKGTLDKWAEATRNTNVSRANPFFNSKGGSFYLGDSVEPLTVINLTTATKIINGAFVYFTDIEKVILGETVATINANAFQCCSKLETLILIGDTVKTLSATNALALTPIADGTGTIYIQPETVDEVTLVAEYKAATNWSTYEAQIKPYSEYTGGAE